MKKSKVWAKCVTITSQRKKYYQRKSKPQKIVNKKPYLSMLTHLQKINKMHQKL